MATRRITVDPPEGETVVVDILSGSVSLGTALSSRYSSASTLTLPNTISERTSFYVPGPGPYNVSVKLDGKEIAGPAGAPVAVSTFPAEVHARIDADELADVAGGGSGGSLPTPSIETAGFALRVNTDGDGYELVDADRIVVSSSTMPQTTASTKVTWDSTDDISGTSLALNATPNQVDILATGVYQIKAYAEFYQPLSDVTATPTVGYHYAGPNVGKALDLTTTQVALAVFVDSLTYYFEAGSHVDMSLALSDDAVAVSGYMAFTVIRLA